MNIQKIYNKQKSLQWTYKLIGKTFLQLGKLIIYTYNIYSNGSYCI